MNILYICLAAISISCLPASAFSDSTTILDTSFPIESIDKVYSSTRDGLKVVVIESKQNSSNKSLNKAETLNPTEFLHLMRKRLYQIIEAEQKRGKEDMINKYDQDNKNFLYYKGYHEGISEK